MFKINSVRISSRESVVLQKFQNEGLSQALKWMASDVWCGPERH